MRKLKRLSHCFLALALCVITMCGMSVTAFAYVDPDASATETEADAAIPEAEATEANPFTPDGNASILDEADSDQNKYFYTIQTANDNTFYMIIDKDRATGNVYLLSMIDENDLMEFVTEEENESKDDGAIPDEFTKPSVTEEPEPETETSEEETEPEVTDPPVETSNGTVTLIALGVLAVIFLIGYYIVKIRNRDDTEDEEDETSVGMDETEEADDADETEDIDEEESADSVPFDEDYPDPADYPDEENV